MGAVESAISHLSDTRSRLRWAISQKSDVVKRSEGNVVRYLSRKKYELARIEADDLVQKESQMECYEIIDKICEKLIQEIPDMFKKPESSLTRVQTDFVGSICWAADKFKNELPELANIANMLKERYEGCRENAWNANSELIYHAELSLEPTVETTLQRLYSATTELSEDDAEITREGIEQCMATYVAGSRYEDSVSNACAFPSRPMSVRFSNRQAFSTYYPPPYDSDKCDPDDML